MKGIIMKLDFEKIYDKLSKFWRKMVFQKNGENGWSK
jgi:hypothetical protein